MPEKISDCVPFFIIGFIVMMLAVFFLWIQNTFMGDISIPENPAFTKGIITEYEDHSYYREGGSFMEKKEPRYVKKYTYLFNNEDYKGKSPVGGTTWISKHITVVVDSKNPLHSVPLVDLISSWWMYGCMFLFGMLGFLSGGYYMIRIAVNRIRN